MRREPRYFLSVTIAVVTICSCAQKRANIADDCLNIHPLESTKEVFSLDQYIDQVELIPLDSTLPINLDSKKIIVLDHSDVLISTGSAILKFNANGQFLFEYGGVGHGHGEFLKIYDVCLNHKKTELLALNHQNFVMKYDLKTGKYIETIKTDSASKNASAILPNRDGGFYFYTPNDTYPCEYNKDFYCLKQFDQFGKYVSKDIAWKDFNIDYPGSPMVSYNYDNTYLIRPQENENICYQVKDGKISKLCRIHFGEANIEPQFSFKNTESPWDKLEEMIKSDSYKTPFCLQKTKKHLYFSAMGPKGMIDHFLIDLEKVDGIHWKLKNTEKYTPFFIIGSDADFLYGVYSNYKKYSGEELNDLDPLTRYLVRNCGLSLDEKDNSVLVKVKFK